MGQKILKSPKQVASSSAIKLMSKQFYVSLCCVSDGDLLTLRGKLNVELKQMKADSVCLKLVFACPRRQVKSALITNVRDSIKHEGSK